MSEPVSAGYRELRLSLLAPAEVRELSRLRPGRVVRDTVVTWAIILSVWAAAAAIGSWWAITAAAVISGNRYYSLWIIAHDGLHRRLFGTTSANDLFNDLFILGPIGAITRINNRNHLRHHQYLGTGDDPDRHKHGCFNKATRPQLIEYLLAVSSLVPSVTHVFGRRGPRPTVKLSRHDRLGYSPRDLAILAGWQAGLFAFFTFFFGWWSYFALWWLPLFVFVFLPDHFRSFVEHSHPEGDEAADVHRLITNRPGWLERQLLAPMNMNYHAAHHLWPSIPYYNLPLADAEMRRKSAHEGTLTWRGSYLSYLGRYFQALPLTDCLPAATRAPTLT
jgi:fatty acid desaturase